VAGTWQSNLQRVWARVVPVRVRLISLDVKHLLSLSYVLSYKFTQNSIKVSLMKESSCNIVGDGPPSKFYAVAVGRSPGVYTSWAECKIRWTNSQMQNIKRSAAWRMPVALWIKYRSSPPTIMLPLQSKLSVLHLKTVRVMLHHRPPSPTLLNTGLRPQRLKHQPVTSRKRKWDYTFPIIPNPRQEQGNQRYPDSTTHIQYTPAAFFDRWAREHQ